jgi:phospholipase/carboxylesterase
MAHGTLDPVIALARAQASRATLLELGYEPSWKTYPMQHSVCMDEVADISRFLRGLLA